MSDEFDLQNDMNAAFPGEENDSAVLAKHKQGTNDYFRKMIEKDYYELPVLSFQELSQEINIQPLGRLKL